LCTSRKNEASAPNDAKSRNTKNKGVSKAMRGWLQGRRVRRTRRMWESKEREGESEALLALVGRGRALEEVIGKVVVVEETADVEVMEEGVAEVVDVVKMETELEKGDGGDRVMLLKAIVDSK
jgi:hypothetical protein